MIDRPSVASALAAAFDAGWYVRTYGEVPALIESGRFLDPLHHYVDTGCREGRSPNAEFQEDYYRSVYPDVAGNVDDQVFSCGFHHYLQHGRSEGRRIRPATRGVLVDLTRFGGADAVQERILIQLSSLFEHRADWDFWLLTREAGHDALSRLDRINVLRVCVDRIAGDVGEYCRGFPITAFLAPFGPSSFYAPGLCTVTILPDPMGGDPVDLERAIAISDALLCLTLSNRRVMIDQWQVERERVKLLHLPSSGGIAVGEPAASGAIVGRTFLLADLTVGSASVDVALAALEALGALPGEPCLVAVATSEAAPRLRAAAARNGTAHSLAVVEDPGPRTRRWLAETCAALLDTGREAMTPGLIEDALSLRRPLICSRLSGDLRTAALLACSFHPDDPASVATACREALADPTGMAAATGDAIARAFPELLEEPVVDPLAPLLERLDETGRPSGPSRELLLGLRDGNRIHAACWFMVPPSGATRSLVLELAVPADYPEPAVVIAVSIPGQPEIPEPVGRGGTARIAVALPPRQVTGRLTVSARRSDGTGVQVHPDWPGIELRVAMVLASGLDLLGPTTAVAGRAVVECRDPDVVVGSVNAAIDAAAPALNALEAAVGQALRAKPALRLAVPGMPSVLRAVAPVALHLTRQQFVDPDLRFHGSNKDQASRQQYLRDRGFRVITEPTRDWKYGDLIKRLDADRHSNPHVIILESMLHHPLIRYLRERFPKARLLVRSHNAEVLHRLHTHTAALLMEQGSRWAWLKPREAFERGRNVLGHWRYDVGALALADHILSISDWETRRYWPYLGPRSKVSTVPYFLPRDLAYAGPVPARKPHRCVCLTSASPGPVIYDALRNFVRLVDGLSDPGDWEFPVTGDLDERHAASSSRCRFIGRVENPIELMSEATSMALLSPYGYGFKTKIIDAVSARSYTLMPQSLLDRHPPEVRPYCLVVDLSSPASFRSALDRSLEPFPAGDPNEALRRQAYAAMDAILGLA